MKRCESGIRFTVYGDPFLTLGYDLRPYTLHLISYTTFYPPRMVVFQHADCERQMVKHKGIVYFIGAGPGDPELMTIKGQKIIKRSDLVLYAGSLVPKKVVDCAKKGARVVDSSSMTLEETHALMVATVKTGGVVARVALVRGEIANIKALITIASPHLGTGRAEQALDVTDIPFPLSMFTDFFGGATYDTAMRSRSLFVDLVRQRPGTLLFWLNNLPHPDIEYFSVVRGQAAVISGDYVVPGYSQDMNNVPALQGKSALIRVNNSYHGLNVLDGNVIVSVLADRI